MYLNSLIKRFDKIKNSNGKKSEAKIRLEMQHTMQNYCPVYRSGKIMKEKKT